MALSSDRFGAKPAVLRCGRCGRFVDWGEAHVQIVCDCRPRLELPPVMVRESTDADRAAARQLFSQDFKATRIVAFGEVMDLDQMPTLVALMHSEPSGALAYRLLGGNTLHIVALATDPMWQRSGVGGHLLAEAELLARRLKLTRIVVATTNDNLPALYFYQRRGYRLTALEPNSVMNAHGAQPGFAGIPVRDEIRLEKRIA